MSKKENFRIGQIVEVINDDETRIARVVAIEKYNEEAVVTYLDDIFMDLETATVQLLNVRKYERKAEQ